MVPRRNIRIDGFVNTPMPARSPAAAAIVALLLAACTSTPDPAPSGSARATDSPSPSVDLCPIEDAAGRLDTAGGVRLASAVERSTPAGAVAAQVGGSGEEAGPGSWQLCLDDGSVIQGSGLCHWSADRTEVLWVIGEDARGLGALVGPFLELQSEPVVLVLDRADADGLIAGYRPTDRTRVEVSATANRAAGSAVFDDLRLHDPTTGEPARAGWDGPETLEVDGILRWACSSAPPFSTGWGPGVVRAAIDEPVGELTWEASCWWALEDRGGGELVPVVTAVDGGFRPAGDQAVAIHVSPLDDHAAFTLTTAATRLEESRSSTYTVGDDPPTFTSRAPDGSAGQLRFTGWRRLHPVEGDPEEPLGGPGGPVEINGVVEWRCGEPRGALVELESPEP